jgi:hypothetical protein
VEDLEEAGAPRAAVGKWMERFSGFVRSFSVVFSQKKMWKMRISHDLIMKNRY